MIVPELAHFFDQGAYDGRREASRPWQPRWDIAPRVFRIAASFGQLGRLSSGESVPLDRSSVTGRSICDLQHLPDDPTGPRPQTKNNDFNSHNSRPGRERKFSSYTSAVFLILGTRGGLTEICKWIKGIVDVTREIARAFVVKHVRRETSTRPLSHITCDSGRRVRPASRLYSRTLRSGGWTIDRCARRRLPALALALQPGRLGPLPTRLTQRHRPARRAQLQRYFYRGRSAKGVRMPHSFTPACKPPWTGSPSDIPLV
jgi:hypothetical protein